VAFAVVNDDGQKVELGSEPSVCIAAVSLTRGTPGGVAPSASKLGVTIHG